MGEEKREGRRWPRGRIAAVAVVIYVVGWLWSVEVLWAGVPGIYWLNVMWKLSPTPVGLLLILAALVLVVVGVVQLIQKKPGTFDRLFAPAIIAIFAGVIIPFAGVFGWNWFPQDTTRLDGRVYYTAAYTTFLESNFAAFECDPVGVLCHQVYFGRECTPQDVRVGEGVADFDRVEGDQAIVEWCGDEVRIPGDGE